MSERIYHICALCLIAGAVLPWALLIFGAGISLASDAEWVQMLSAYSVAFGLLVMAAAFLFRRALNFLNGN
ncbi:hypothetical protein ORIO_00490 [Cereibacter azotoformans]|uniref:hypothetical protein n=1 Tax=Cereibacter azotoformans TaxID=43057 RepID=UPI0005C5E24B|nr:hypothetical protein [Cereibacter azotoformans]ULB08419.1 hypothetical protein ORIO_00490 [Cereibacter azotoformans]